MNRGAPLVRIAFSIALLALMLYLVRQGKFQPLQKNPPPSSGKPFPSIAPSSEGANRFAWVPVFPGAMMGNIRTKATREELSYGFDFQIKRDFRDVLTYYEDQLRKTGFKVSEKTDAEGGLVHAESDGRTLNVDAEKAADMTMVNIFATQK